MNENEEVYYRNQKGSVFLQKEHQDRTWTGKMFVPDTELFKDPTTDSSYFGTFNRITVYANKNTREDRCSFLFQSKFCGFVCNHFTFCQQLYNANSHRGWKTPLKSSSPTFLMKLEQGAQVSYIQSGLEYLHRQRLHNLSRHPASPSQ